MIVNNSKRETNTVSFDVALDAAEFDKYVNGAYLKNRKSISVPGFRKGKAPRMVIEGLYGAEVFYEEAIENAANDAFTFGAEQEKLRTVGRPMLSDSQVTGEKGVVLSFRTDVWPEVTLGQYKGLEAVKDAVEVPEEDIDREIERMRKQNARLVTVDRPAENGDTVMIDYVGRHNGEEFDGGSAENQSLELGSDSFVPGFESQLVGISAGEERDLDIHFSENYVPELANKDVVFHVKCNEVKMEELPEVDDEFAKDNDFDTVEDMKADIRSRLLSSRETAAQNAFTDRLVEAAGEKMTAEIPASMVESRLDAMLQDYAQYVESQGMSFNDYLQMMGGDAEKFRESMRATAEKQSRTEVLLDAVATAENIEATEDDYKEECARLAANYGMPLEQVERLVDREALKGDILRRLAIKVITDNGVAVERPAEEKAEAAEKE